MSPEAALLIGTSAILILLIATEISFRLSVKKLNKSYREECNRINEIERILTKK